MKQFLSVIVLLLALAGSAWAGWQQSETEHFTIIYEPEDAATVAELVGFAEDVYDELTSFLGLDSDRRIPVVIRGDAGDANGYFTYLPTRIVIYTATPSTSIVQPNLDQWLRIVFVHELTHYLHISQRVGPGRFLTVFGPSLELLNLLFTPRWLAEGLAIHAETALTAGGRGRSPVFEMQYASAILEDEFWSFNQNFYGSSFAPRSRPYVGGHVVSDYIIRTYGIASFMDITTETLRRPIPGVRRAIREVLDLTPAVLYADVVADLEVAFADRGWIAGGEPVSPDDNGYWFLIRGSTSLHGGPATGYTRLYDREQWSNGIDPADERAALKLDADSFSVAVRDGLIVTVLPFTDTFAPDSSVGYTDLVVVDGESGRVSRITQGKRLYHPVIGPEPSVYAVERIGSYSRLVRIHLSNGSVEPIWEPPRTHLSAPAVSPDGRHLAVVAAAGGEQDLWIVDAADGLARCLTPTSDVPEYFPIFVSNERIWFTANPDGPLGLYELSLLDGSVRLRISDPDGVFYASPLDDGAVYASYSASGPTVKQVSVLEDEPTAGYPARFPANPGSGLGSPPSEPESSVQDATLASRRYLDWPRPELWLPVVLPLPTDEGIFVMGGALLAAASPLEQHVILAAPFVMGPPFIPFGLATYSLTAAPWSASLDARFLTETGSGEPGVTRYHTNVTVAAGRTIVAWNGSHLRNSVGLSVQGRYVGLSPAGVGMADFLSGIPDRIVLGAAGINYSGRRETRAADLLGPAGITASIGATAGVVITDGDPVPPGAVAIVAPGTIPVMTGALVFRLPTGPGMTEVGFAISSANPAAVVNLSLESPTWLMDVPLGGIGLTGMGLIASAEQEFEYPGGSLWEPGAWLLQVSSVTTVGLELALHLGGLGSGLVPAVGLAATISHDGGAVVLEPTLRLVSAIPGIVIGTRK